jgi:hypothetical protein
MIAISIQDNNTDTTEVEINPNDPIMKSYNPSIKEEMLEFVKPHDWINYVLKLINIFK